MKTIGANIVLEGEASYREALKTITGQQRELASEMELTSAQFDGQQNSLEALEDKYRILGDMIEKQKEKIDVYASAVDSAKERQNNATLAYSEYAAQLERAKEDLEKLESSSDSTEESIEEQRQEVERLKNAYAEASQECQAADRDVSYWQTSLNKAQSDLVLMEKELEKTNSYMDEARQSTDKCASSIDGFGKEADESAGQASHFGDVLKGTLTSEVIMTGLKTLVDLTEKVGKGLYEMAAGAAFWADEVNTLSTQTGIATDTIQALKYSEELLDTSLETVTSSMAKNIRSMQSAKEGSEKYVEAYQTLGLTVTDANGKLRDSEEVFWEVVDALGKIENATERDAISMQIFGRNAQSLNSLIAAGSKGFNEMYQEAQNLGYIMDHDTIVNLTRTSDAIERVSKTADAIKNQIGADVAPIIEQAAGDLQQLMVDNADEIAEIIADIIPALVDGLTFVVENLDTIIPVVEGVVTGFLTFKAATTATAALNAVMAVLPELLSAATIEQAALNAVQAISPMGAVAAAAGLLVTGLGMLLSKTAEYTPRVHELTDEEKKLLDSMKEVNEQVTNSRDAFSDNVASMATNKATAQELIAKLRELQPAAGGDAEKMREMEQTVGQLNTLMPGLGLSINSVTGEMNMSIDAVEAYTDALMHQIEVEAYSDRMVELLQQQIDLKNELTEKEDAYNEAVQRNNDAFAERDRAMAEYDAALEAYMAGTEEISDAQIRALQEASLAASENASEVALATSDIRAEYQILQGNLDDVNEEYTEYQELLADTAPIEAAADAVEELSAKEVEFRGHTVTVTGDVEEALNELEKQYIETYDAARNSLESQMGLFQEFQHESQSIDAMTKSLEDQTKEMTDYSTNLQKALDLGVDPQVIESIRELGISGAGYLEEIVEAAEAAKGGNTEALESFMTAWSGYQEALSETASLMTDIDMGFAETTENIIEQATTANEELLSSQEEFNETYVQGWEAATSDSAQAVLDSEPVIAENVTTVASSAIMSLNQEFGIGEDGRSTKGIEAGKAFGQGIADGVKAMEDEIVAAVAKVGQAALDEAKEWARKIDEALGENL